MSVCTEYCRKCVYRRTFSMWLPYCDYICMVGKPRPCPAGDGCSARVRKGERKKKTRPTKEQLEQRRERHKEMNRLWYQRNKEKHLEKVKRYHEEHREEIAARKRERRRREEK